MKKVIWLVVFVSSIALITAYLKYKDAQVVGVELSEKEVWEKVRHENTISACEAFLNGYPNGDYSSQAHKLITSIKQARLSQFRDAKKTKIIVNEFFGGAKSERLSSAVASATSDILKYADIETLSGDSSDFDFIVKIRLNAQPLRASYTTVGLLYTGASVNGTIAFESRDGFQISSTFGSTYSPPFNITSNQDLPRSADGAPLHIALNPDPLTRSSFNIKLTELVYKAFGIAPLMAYINVHGKKDRVANGSVNFVAAALQLHPKMHKEFEANNSAGKLSDTTKHQTSE